MKSVRVILWNSEIGLLSEDPNNKNYYLFKYNDQYLTSNIEVCPLLMKKSPIVFQFENLSIKTFKGLPPLLIDSLPDRYGEKLLSIWKEKNNKKELDPIDVLLYIGKRGMGALEFEPCLDDLKEAEAIEIDSLVEVAKEVLSKKNVSSYSIKNEKDLMRLIDVGSSVGGARAKALIAMNKDGDIKSGQIPHLKGYTYYILKFDGLSNDLSEDNSITYYTRIEYVYYKMAIDAGITMQETFLLKKGNCYHFVSKRFDRDENGQKIHMLSLAGMIGFDYLEAGENSYEDVAKILVELKANNSDVIELFRRMVFNVLGKNNDDHIKNISFLMDRGGQWKLSPAYDLSYSYNPDGDWTKHHQMRINNKVDDISYNDLIESARSMGIKEAKAKRVIDEVKAAIKNFEQYAKEENIPKDVIDLIKSNLPTI